MLERRFSKAIVVIRSICILCFSVGCVVTQTTGSEERSLSVSVPDVVVHGGAASTSYATPQGVKPRGLGIGFVWPQYRDLPPTQRPQTVEVKLKEGEPFNPFLILNTTQSVKALITVLLDYKQVQFELDGQMALLHEVTVDPNGDLELPMRVEVNGAGAHDLLVIAFEDPYNASMDPFYRSSMNERKVARRARVIVGESTQPARTFDAPLQGMPVPPNVQLNLGIVFASAPGDSKTHPSERQLYLAHTQPGQIFNFQIWVSNLKGDKESDYALIPFLNFHQIQLNGQDTLLVHLKPNEEAIIDSSLQAPQAEGVYQMQIVYLFDPYRSILQREVRAASVSASPRFGLKVEYP